MRVPVTTVPEPRAENTRSTHNLGRPLSRGGGAARITASSAARSSSMPRPLRPSTGTTGHVDSRVASTRSASSTSRELERLGVDDVGLGERDDAVADVEQIQNLDVLGGLRHPTLVRGDDEHRHVDGADPGEHVLDEPHMAGHVDEADHLTAGQGREREAEVDREAARLLLREAIRVRAGERENERRLPVVDVARSGNDPHVRPIQPTATSSAAVSRSSSAGSTVRRSQITRSVSMRAITPVARRSRTTRSGAASFDGDADRGDVEAG